MIKIKIKNLKKRLALVDTRLGIQPSRHRAKNKRKKKVGPRGQEAGNPTSRVQGQKEKKKEICLAHARLAT